MAGKTTETVSQFQSTPPARGATLINRYIEARIGISIHAPREGGDIRLYSANNSLRVYFNPRPPRGGRLLLTGNPTTSPMISIHAPREGGDNGQAVCFDCES